MKRGLLLGAVAAVLVAARVRRGESPSTPAMGAALMAASVPALARQAARERQASVLPLLLIAQALRLGMAVVSHDLVHRRLYGDATDAWDYDVSGERISELLRQGRLAEALTVARLFPFDTELRVPVGTNFIRLLNGGLYATLGPSRRNSFVVFSWLGFWGLFLFYRAFVVAVPRGSSRTYLRLLFLSPSLLFWTASLGKEAWMVLGLGVGAFGGARTLTGSPRRGLPIAALGLALTMLGRPKVPGLSRGADLEAMARNTSEGTSVFKPPALRSPLDVIPVTATVLFRPHFLEAHNMQSRAAAAEGVALLLVSVARLRWLAAALISMPRQPYLGANLACTAAFVAMLSAISNFGMLVRYRAPMLPFYLALLSVPPRRA